VTEVALIDPAQAKAFEIRRYAIGIRQRIPEIDNLDTLSELSATMLACRHRLRSLHEEVVQANRTHLLIMQRVGELLAGYHANDGDSYLRSRHSRTYRTKARLIAAHPEVVREALNQPNVSIAQVVRKIQQLQSAMDEQSLSARAPRLVAELNVHEGDWWKVGNHVLFCGSFHGTAFQLQREKMAPVLTYVDTWGDSLWNHHWFSDASPVYAFTDTPKFCTGVPAWFSHDSRRLVSFVVDGAEAAGMRYEVTWLPTMIHDQRGPDRLHAIRDVVRLRPKPNSVHDQHKPLTLVTTVISWMSYLGEVVMDPRLGDHGLTLRACEQLGRICLGAETDPNSLAMSIIRSGLPAERMK